MSGVSYTVFPTAIGVCGLAWNARGVAGVDLPQRSEPESRRRMERRFPGAREAAPQPDWASVVADIVALLGGDARDLRDVRLDTDGVAAFDLAVYRVTRAIARGETLSYGEVASRVGERGAARAVGRALGSNPFPIIVPCHRVLGAGGKVGGFSARGGLVTKARLLTIERARTSGEPLLFDDLPVTVRPASGRTRP